MPETLQAIGNPLKTPAFSQLLPFYENQFIFFSCIKILNTSLCQTKKLFMHDVVDGVKFFWLHNNHVYAYVLTPFIVDAHCTHSKTRVSHLVHF